jgi:transposase InsO family protein
MMYPLVLDLAADGIPVTVTCRVLGFSKQAFYRWRAKPYSNRDWHDAHLVNALDVHHDDPAFGYRFIADELAADGITAGENRIQRLCSEHPIWSVFAKKRGLSRKPGPPVHDDLVQRDFTADELDELWFTDLTKHPTGEGKRLHLRRQGRLLDPDRRLLDGPTDDGPAGDLRPAERHRLA